MINKIFKNLNEWRHLPNYQLERRTDIFFSIYLKEIISRRFNKEIHEIVIPEFPLKKKGNNKLSSKLDYLVFDKNLETIYFVELKTDMESVDEKQKAFYLDKRELGFSGIIEELKEIFKATKKRKQYYNLFILLDRINAISFKDKEKLRARIADNKSGQKRLIDKIRCDIIPSIEVVYIQPEKRVTEIVFDDIITYLDGSDALTSEFRKALKEWQSPADSFFF